MILRKSPPLHLTYCLNIHPGESWQENEQAIHDKTLAVRAKVAPGAQFGLGLRVAHQAACDLDDPAVRKRAAEFFAGNGLYAFTINGFPYGRFHVARVKENVYAPDWRAPERLAYTKQLADVLADLLPEGMTGSISTVPGSFKSWIQTRDDVREMVANLADIAGYLSGIHERTGKEIHLGLEPEPECFLQTTPETLAFFKDEILTVGVNHLADRLKCGSGNSEQIIRRHLGVCFDTCHVALQFEDLAESWRQYCAAGIRISKVQISAALEVLPTPDALLALKHFCEPVYLHQVKARMPDGSIRSWVDLPDALDDEAALLASEQARIHFHVPLFFTGSAQLGSTISHLTPAFLAAVQDGSCEHLEIETYTFDVLPAEVHPKSVVDSIAREYEWALAALRA